LVFQKGVVKGRKEGVLSGLSVPCYIVSMCKTLKLTAVIEYEKGGYVALCPELDIASQGDTIEEARKNLTEAIELFFETAGPLEITNRLHSEIYVTSLEVSVG